jgi:CTP synthase
VKLDDIVCRKLKFRSTKPELVAWTKFVQKIKKPKSAVTVGFVGKYVQHQDAYKSIAEALIHAGAVNNARVNVQWLDSEKITTENVGEMLAGLDGILIAPGFGYRGVEGKITAIQHVREQGIPFFGICLGMQCAVIEFARNVCGIKQANSSEFKKGKFSVIDFLPEQRTITAKGGTMRLGSYPCVLREGTKAHEAYRSQIIRERHRHRYEVNNDFRATLEQHGLVLSGVSPDGKLVEMMELRDHPWFVGCQFHPELKSRAVEGHPLFIKFVEAALANKAKD